MTRVDLVLDVLRAAGARGATNTELVERGCGYRYGSAIDRARKAGHIITTERIGANRYRYQLVSEAAAAPSVSEQPMQDAPVEQGALFALQPRPSHHYAEDDAA